VPLSDDERRYSDEEFALILRTASEIREGPDPAPPREGLTLRQIREIAVEVGIDPDRVARAAALLPSAPDSAVARWLGGPPRHRLEHVIPIVVPAGELGRVIDVARKAVATQGENREIMGGLEWTASAATASFGASLTPRDGGTVLQASTDRTESMAGIYGGVGMSTVGIVGLLLVKLVFGETDAGIVASLLYSLPPAFLFARTVWSRSTKKYRERLVHLVEAMVKEAEKAAERAEGGDRPPDSTAPAEEDRPQP
jgi:hypothetical protein